MHVDAIYTPSELHRIALMENVGGGLKHRMVRRAALDAALASAEELGIRSVTIAHPDDAPSTLQEVNDTLVARMRPPYPGSPATTFEGYDVTVSAPQDEDSATFWGDAGNALFRAIHDVLHYRGQYEFNLEGEWQVCKQELAIYSRNADPEYRDFIRTLVEAETWGQTGFYDIMGTFPLDQNLFLACYIVEKNPRDATQRYLKASVA